MYRLYAVRVFTSHWDEALAFYRDVLAFPLVFSDPAMGWAQFDLGTASIGVERCDPADEESVGLVGRFTGISIEVEDIHEVHEQLAAQGVEFVSAPTAQPWGGILADFRDPDGNVLTLLGRPG
jgi:catechol 2,3-dioxygenase-like lactoylglutathione lyase family enzyme